MSPRITHRADLMHSSYTSNLGLAITSNYVLTADGTGGVVWAAGGSLSYASNSTAVSSLAAAGASALVSRADHVHYAPVHDPAGIGVARMPAGVTQLEPNDQKAALIFVAGSGDVELFGQGGITLAPNNYTAGGGNSDKVFITGGHGLVLPVLSADPAAGASEEGQIYRNSTAGTIKVYLGGAWKTITTS